MVNNNAAATLLILAGHAPGVKWWCRGDNSLRLAGPSACPTAFTRRRAAGEVGTTNKTHLRDYVAALSENTAAVMRVNPSNYRVVGFTAEVSVSELVSLKRDRDLLVIDDLGCGALIGLERFGLEHEPTAGESIAAGADLVCFSGDKLIGGPQAGIIVGRAALIQRIRKHPLTRMLRIDKCTDIALEHTLRLFLDPDRLPETNPTYTMLAVPLEGLHRRARGFSAACVKGGTCSITHYRGRAPSAADPAGNSHQDLADRADLTRLVRRGTSRVCAVTSRPLSRELRTTPLS